MTQIHYTKQEIIGKLIRIVATWSFNNNINIHADIHTMLAFPDDINQIKNSIRETFNYTVPDTATRLNIKTLAQMIYTNMRTAQPGTTNSDKNVRRIPTTDPKIANELKRHDLFNIVFRQFRPIVGNVRPNETVGDIFYEIGSDIMGTRSGQLQKNLRILEQQYDITVDNDTRVCDIVEKMEQSLVARGEMQPTPKEYMNTEIDPLWRAIVRALPLHYLLNVLHYDIGISAPAHKVAASRSFEEFKKIVYKNQQNKEHK